MLAKTKMIIHTYFQWNSCVVMMMYILSVNLKVFISQWPSFWHNSTSLKLSIVITLRYV